MRGGEGRHPCAGRSRDAYTVRGLGITDVYSPVSASLTTHRDVVWYRWLSVGGPQRLTTYRKTASVSGSNHHTPALYVHSNVGAV